MTPENGLCIIKENHWKNKLPKRLKYLIEKKLEPEAFFCFDKKPLILFYDSPQNKQKIFKDIWNFNESPIVIINERDAVEIYNGFSYLRDKSALDKLEDQENLDNFSYFELVTGKSLEQYHTKLKQQNRVDFNLLENIRDARKILIDEHGIKDSLANALIGKCIFVRYLIDRGVKIKFKGQSQEWTNNDFCNLFDNKTNLINFFKYLRKQFNGEAFLLNDYKLRDIPKGAFLVLKKLLMGTYLSSGQLSLFDIYDFSIIPVEFISNVYEHFIGKENQEKKGAYYTPKFLVDYILSETVEKYFKEFPKQYNCKVLDPACGSGIFLVEALRRIVEHYIELNNNISKKTLKKSLKELAENNVFGIDKDEDAVNVAIFSIYLALLDYQEPKDIENFTFPNLRENGNFHTADFFDSSKEFNKNFNKIDFNFIIGNPPWKRGASPNNLFLKYIKNRRKIEDNKDKPKIDISNKEIAQAFLLRTSDFSDKKTKCALIVTSKTLYNLNAKKFRKYFLYNFFIDKVFELAPVAPEIFNVPKAPATILFFRLAKSESTDLNETVFSCLKPNPLFSTFKLFVLQRNDIKQIVQKNLKNYDWIWKVLLYGNYLDFNLIKRLKTDYITIEDYLKNNNILYGQGIIVGNKDKIYDTRRYIGKPLINHKKDIEQYHVVASDKWTEEKVTRKRNKDLFKAPFLLVKHGLKHFKAVTAISKFDALYKHSLTGIKGNLKTLRTLCGLLNSDLFEYFAINNSIAGIDRGRAHDKEKFNFPFSTNFEISKLIGQIEEITKQLYEEKKQPLNPKVSTLKTEKKKFINKLNKEIFKSFDLNKQELALVDYAINVTIPLIIRHNGYKNLFSSIPFRDKLLEEYVKTCLFRFENSFKEKHLKAEVWHTANIIGIFFKVVADSSSDDRLIEWKNKEDKNLLRKIISLGTMAITENLFIQKDIRGFEKNGFYIIKPNEKKLWHKAIAYLDVDGFMDAILRVGKEQYNT